MAITTYLKINFTIIIMYRIDKIQNCDLKISHSRWNIRNIFRILLLLKIISLKINIITIFFDIVSLLMSSRNKSLGNNCERLERESGSHYMLDLGQVSIVITGRMGTQCLIAAFYPFHSPFLLFAYTYPTVVPCLSWRTLVFPGTGRKSICLWFESITTPTLQLLSCWN